MGNAAEKFYQLFRKMITVEPGQLPVSKVQILLQGLVAPRPIAFASTVDKEGSVNLSPFSFFNMFSTQPPILIFSPSRRVRNNTTKHTLQNVLEVPEVVINVVSYSMVQQASLASVEFPKGVNEFGKAGFTEVPSQRVKPPRVGEAPASFECKVNQVLALGTEGGAGNLVICEVLMIHYREDLVDEQGKINPWKVDAVARMGNDYYCRAQGENIFTVPKPNEKLSVGFDQIPAPIRTSRILTGNDLGMLGNIEQLPDAQQVNEFKQREDINRILKQGEDEIHRLAQRLLQEGKIKEAWMVLL